MTNQCWWPPCISSKSPWLWPSCCQFWSQEGSASSPNNSDCRNDPRRQWKLLNKLLGRNTTPTPLKADISSLTNFFGSVVSDPERPPSLQIPQGPRQLTSFANFTPVTTTEVCKLLKKISPFKSTGSDELPPLPLKICAEELAGPLCLIFNESLSLGSFPDIYKVASVFPLFKKGNPECPSNYRPISLLPIVSKLLEKIVLHQLQRYINTHPELNILPPQQFAYRSDHSTEDALSLAISKWQQRLDDGQNTGVLFLDMSKAFDRVKHQPLINELYSCGICGTALSWFASYLSARRQTVTNPSTKTSGDSVTCSRGVPQGSVLGPVLFTIYTRHVTDVTPTHTSNILYADDIGLYTSSSCINTIQDRLSESFDAVKSHLTELGLLLNPDKTQLLIVRRKTTPFPPTFTVICGNFPVSPSQCVRYLGVLVDQHLAFKEQVGKVVADVNRKLAAFRRIRHHITTQAQRSFYLSIIQSTMEYASNCYVHTISATLYNTLIRCFKRSLRITFGYPPCHPTATICQRHKIIPVAIRYNLKIFCLVYKCVHGRRSPLLAELFVLRSNSNHTNALTRGQSALALALPNASSRYGFYALPYLAADRWNSLPAACRQAASFAMFNSTLRSLFCNT